MLEPISFTPNELNILSRNDAVDGEVAALWNQFEDAATYGSLIRPNSDLVASMAMDVDANIETNNLFTQRVSERARRVIKQAEILTGSYAVVVTNPPYMGSKNMNGALSSWLKDNYPKSKADLMTAFMDRSVQLCSKRGMWAMINLPSWMFLSSFQALRESILASQFVTSLVHLGRGVFGSDFGSVAFVMQDVPVSPKSKGTYRRLFEKHVDVRTNETIESLFRNLEYNRFEISQDTFHRIPGWVRLF